MRFLPLLTLIGAVSTSAAFAQPNEAPTTIANPPAQPQPLQQAPRPAAPKAQIELDLKSFFATLNSQTVSAPTDYGVSSFISGGRIGFFGLSEWKDYFVAARGKTYFRLDQIEFVTLKTDTARVKVLYSLLTPNNVAPVEGQPAQPEIQTAKEEEVVDLKREIVAWDGDGPDKWRIVPPTYENLQRYRTLSLQHITYYGSQRAGTFWQLRAEMSATRLKQIGLGVMQFVQDYDEQFLFQNEFWREAIDPYVKNDSLFLIPGTQTPYTFNDNLSDKSLAAVQSPAQTVLFYEGENERPVFRYAGKAAICFADGHVKSISPEDAKDLIWKP